MFYVSILASTRSVFTAMLLAAGLVTSLGAQASVVISGTRVVYKAGSSEQTIKLTNKGKAAALVQVWVDKGEQNADPTGIKVPFTVTPPVARIDPGRAQTLRVFHTGEALPQDKESVFWLNVLEIPPERVGQDDGKNYLQFAVRSRIKLFYRPTKLVGEAAAAHSQVAWRAVRDGGAWFVEGRNPSAYHVSLASVEVVGSGVRAAFNDGGMIAPGASARFPLKGDVVQAGGAIVHYRSINDYGGITEGDAPLR